MKLFLAALLLCGCVMQSVPDAGRTRDGHNTKPDYELVWADEFDQEVCPSPRNWTNEKGFVRNHELQWYQPENAFCKDGMLVLQARREQRRNPAFDAQSDRWKKNREFIEYTSASLKTQGLWSWRYGRFEMRARIRTDPGLWPVFWTLGTQGDWPAFGEIDILESYRGLLLANAAWGGDGKGLPSWNITQRPVAGLGDNWVEEFHVWRMDWSEQSIELYVDDRLLNAIALESTGNAQGIEPRNPFHHPHYLLLSLAVGGHKGGDPSATEFPANFEIDYVRVYQRPLADSGLTGRP